jgi:hypothetical protein
MDQSLFSFTTEAFARNSIALKLLRLAPLICTTIL